MKRKKLNILLKNDFTRDSRVLKEAHTLSLKFDVTVLAIHRKELRSHETIGDFQVKRLKTLPNFLGVKAKRDVISKVIEVLVFNLKSFFHSLSSDYIHCNDLETLPIGCFVKILRLGRCKVIYDAHEYETERIGLSPFRKTLYKILENIFIVFVDETITVSNTIKNEYIKLYKLSNVHVVLNTPLYQDVKKQNFFREKFSIPSTAKIFIYQGVITQGRNITRIIDAFKKINDIGYSIVFLGYGPNIQEVKEASVNFNNIFLHDAVSPELLLNYTSSADYGIHIPEPICKSYEYSLPNKIFEYLMADLPVIVSDFIEMGEFVKTNGIGVVCEWDDIDSICQAIKEIAGQDIEKFKTNVKKVKKEYCWENQEEKLFEAYKN